MPRVVMCAPHQRVPTVTRVLRLNRRVERVLISLNTIEITLASSFIDTLAYGMGLPNSPLLWVLRFYSAQATALWCRRVWEDLLLPSVPRELRNSIRDAKNAVEQRLVELLSEHLHKD